MCDKKALNVSLEENTFKAFLYINVNYCNILIGLLEISIIIITGF